MRDKKKILEYFRVGIDKYKYILMVCLIGVILTAFPGKDNGIKESTVQTDIVSLEDGVSELESKLEQILSSVSGVGRVRVAITADTSVRTVYAYEEDRSMTVGVDSKSVDSRTTLVSVGSSGSPQALTVRTDQPVYRGALIVCDGATDPSVRLEIAQAVSSLVGIGTDRIVISKMEN